MNRELSSHSSSPLREILVAPPTVPLSPQSSWGGALLTSLKEFQKKGLFKYKGLSIPAGEVFRPLTSNFCNKIASVTRAISA